MSNKTYNDLWHSTQKLLECLAVNDYQKLALDPEFDRNLAQRCVFELYAKYIQAANRMENVYDQMVQPQKRIIIRKLLDSTLGRIIELKHDLVAIDMMEFSYNDDVIRDLKLLPKDLELTIPRYFLRENQDDIAYKKVRMFQLFSSKVQILLLKKKHLFEIRFQFQKPKRRKQ